MITASSRPVEKCAWPPGIDMSFKDSEAPPKGLGLWLGSHSRHQMQSCAYHGLSGAVLQLSFGTEDTDVVQVCIRQ